MSTDELIAAVLRLPAEDRVRVAEEVLSSLEEPEEVVETAWAEELERRSRDIEEGRVKCIPLETVMAELKEKLEAQRAGRTPS